MNRQITPALGRIIAFVQQIAKGGTYGDPEEYKQDAIELMDAFNREK